MYLSEKIISQIKILMNDGKWISSTIAHFRLIKKRYSKGTSYFTIQLAEYLSCFFRHPLINAFCPSINDPRIFPRPDIGRCEVHAVSVRTRTCLTACIFLKTVHTSARHPPSPAQNSESSAAGGHFSKLPEPCCINNQRLRAVHERR